MDEEIIRARVQQMVRTGALTCDDPEQTWAGHPTGQRCAICTELITSPKPEYEVELPGGQTLIVDQRCYAIWRDVCDEVEPTGAPPRPE
jgi:hypothetical protein